MLLSLLHRGVSLSSVLTLRSPTTTKDAIEYGEDELAFTNPAEDIVSRPFNKHFSAIFFFVSLLLFVSPYTLNNRKCPNGN